jgi:drug/metabolite transporter (DMT)-like permease
LRRFTSTDLMLLTPPLMWSLHIVGSRYVLTHGLTPIVYVIFRGGIGAILMSTLVLLHEGSLRIEGRRNQIQVIVASGVLGVNQVVFGYALHFTTAVTTSLMFGIFPIVTTLLSASIGLERLTRRMLGLGLVSFAGVALVVLGVQGGVKALSGQVTGILFALAIPVTWSLFTVLVSVPMRTQSTYRVNAIGLWGTAIGGLLGGVWTLDDIDYGAVSGLSWASLAYSIVGALVIGNVIWFRAIRRVGPSRSAFFLNLQPFGAAVLAVLLLGEHIGVVQLLGGVLIAFGIVLSRRATTTDGGGIAVGEA